MACIGSDAGGIRELIRDGETGLNVRADHQATLEAARTLAVGPGGRSALGERALAGGGQRQWRHMAMAYEAAYRQAARLAPRAEGGRVKPRLLITIDTELSNFPGAQGLGPRRQRTGASGDCSTNSTT